MATGTKKAPRIKNVWWRNGRAYGRVEKDGRELRKPLETTDPKVARERVKQWLADLEGQRWGEKPRRLYDEAVAKFIEEHLPRLKPRGAQRYLQSLKNLTEHFEGVHLDDITSGTLSNFENARRRVGNSSGTIRNDLWCLSAMMTCAMEWEWIEGNRVSAYLRSRSKRGLLMPSPVRTRYLHEAEETELLSRCRGYLGNRRQSGEADHVMLAAGIALTIDIGLRKEELLAADWTMVDLDKGEWHVPRELAKAGRKKGRGRTIPILPRSLAILKALPRRASVQAGDNDPMGRTTAPFILWHENEGGAYRYADLLPQLQDIASGGRTKAIRIAWDRLREAGLKLTDARRAEIEAKATDEAWANEIPDLIWHDLRRTCGCRLLQVWKLSMEEVSKWLGHSSVTQTEKVYAFLEVKQLHDAVATSPALEDWRRKFEPTPKRHRLGSEPGKSRNFSDSSEDED